MYLLKRLISPYNAPDLLLGCFRDLKAAQFAQQQYKKCMGKDDPWKIQGYWEVDLENDVIILHDIPVVNISPTQDTVYIISSFAEGFGQIVRKFQTICGSIDSAHQRVKELNNSFQGSFPEYCRIEQILLEELLSDEPEKSTATF